jgi:hypothetical protein
VHVNAATKEPFVKDRGESVAAGRIRGFQRCEKIARFVKKLYDPFRTNQMTFDPGQTNE